MALSLVLLQFIAHLLADFIFQSQKQSDRKERKVITVYHVYHILVVGVLSYALSLDFGFWRGALAVTVIHFLTDMLKSWLITKSKDRNYFFLDQIIHLVTMVVIVLAYSEIWGIDFIIDIETKTIAIIAGFILCAKPSNILIKYLFAAFSIETPKESGENPENLSLPNAGKLIGIVERFLALALIIMGEYEAVGLIIAAKSILRFSGTPKSEYVLVGTLLSFGIAAFAGMLINLI